MENNLSVVNLSKKYHPNGNKKKKESVLALDNISFSLTNGLYGLLGPNGAGKSTLISIITGSLKQTSGNVKWNDRVISNMGIEFRRILGFMPQQQGLYSTFTGGQFLSYFCALKEIERTKTKNEVERVASAVNLTDELDKRLDAYSGGMKQRLLLAAALIGNPQLMILDEPTAGLDPKERVNIRNLLSCMSQERVILVATHVVSDIEDVADEVLLLKKGQLIDEGSPKHLIEKYCSINSNLEDVYLTIFGESV